MHDCYDNDIVPILKQNMYGMSSPRLRSYGWEQCPISLFNINKYKLELLKTIGMIGSEIVWGDMIAGMINSTTNSNTLFR